MTNNPVATAPGTDLMALTNVARASLEELRLDYEDFLRQRGLQIWPREDPRRGELITRRPKTADDVAAWAKSVKHGQSGQHGLSGRPAKATATNETQSSIPSTASTESIGYDEIAANGALTLIAVATSLLSRQLATLEKNFLQEGGFTERLYRARTQSRRR